MSDTTQPYEDHDEFTQTGPDATIPIETNDAVAGETVLPGAGDGNDGPTGGSPKEESPLFHEHSAGNSDGDARIDADN